MRDLTAVAPWSPWSKPPVVSQISEVACYRRVRPDCRHAMVVVVEAAHCAMVAGARLGGGGHEHGAATALYLLGGWLGGKKWRSTHSTASVASGDKATPCRDATFVASLRAIRRMREERERMEERER
jgi:hypothetical protein